MLATRFITFHEGSFVVMQYLPQKPLRNYGPFKPPNDEAGKPLPVVQWDSQVVWTSRIINLRQVSLLNYKMVSAMDDPEDAMIEVRLTFSEISFDVVPVTSHDPSAQRPYRTPFRNE